MKILGFWYNYFHSGRFISPKFDLYFFFSLFGIYTSFGLYGCLVRLVNIVHTKNQLALGVIVSTLIGLAMTYLVFFSKRSLKRRIENAAMEKYTVFDVIISVVCTIAYFLGTMYLIGSHKEFFNSIK